VGSSLDFVDFLYSVAKGRQIRRERRKQDQKMRWEQQIAQQKYQASLERANREQVRFNQEQANLPYQRKREEEMHNATIAGKQATSAYQKSLARRHDPMYQGMAADPAAAQPVEPSYYYQDPDGGTVRLPKQPTLSQLGNLKVMQNEGGVVLTPRPKEEKPAAEAPKEPTPQELMEKKVETIRKYQAMLKGLGDEPHPQKPQLQQILNYHLEELYNTHSSDPNVIRAQAPKILGSLDKYLQQLVMKEGLSVGEAIQKLEAIDPKEDMVSALLNNKEMRDEFSDQIVEIAKRYQQTAPVQGPQPLPASQESEQEQPFNPFNALQMMRKLGSWISK
jgi:hypothetical protein